MILVWGKKIISAIGELCAQNLESSLDEGWAEYGLGAGFSLLRDFVCPVGGPLALSSPGVGAAQAVICAVSPITPRRTVELGQCSSEIPFLWRW